MGLSHTGEEMEGGGWRTYRDGSVFDLLRFCSTSTETISVVGSMLALRSGGPHPIQGRTWSHLWRRYSVFERLYFCSK